MFVDRTGALAGRLLVVGRPDGEIDRRSTAANRKTPAPALFGLVIGVDGWTAGHKSGNVVDPGDAVRIFDSALTKPESREFPRLRLSTRGGMSL